MAEAEKFKDAVDDNTLFLTLTARTKVEVSKTVYQWFLITRLSILGICFRELDFKTNFSGNFGE